MPRGDRTGPSGDGPTTGRGMGYCAGNDHPGIENPRSNWRGGYGGRFQGGTAYGRGAGIGFRHGYGNYSRGGISNVSEKTLIENEIRILKDQLAGLENRLSKIEEK